MNEFHPAIESFLATVKNNEAPAHALEALHQALEQHFRREPMIIVHLYMITSDLVSRNVEPISRQLLNLLDYAAELEENENAERARKPTEKPKAAASSGLEPNKPRMLGIGMRKS